MTCQRVVADSYVSIFLKSIDDSGVSVRRLNPCFRKDTNMSSRALELENCFDNPAIDVTNAPSDLKGYDPKDLRMNRSSAVANALSLETRHACEFPLVTGFVRTANKVNEFKSFLNGLRIH